MPVLFRCFGMPLLAALLVAACTAALLQANRDAVVVQSKAQLDARLEMMEQLMEQWQRRQLRQVRSLIHSPSERQWLSQQLDQPLTADARAGSEARQWQLYRDLGYHGYALFDAAQVPPAEADSAWPQAAQTTLVEAQRLGQALSRPFAVPDAWRQGQFDVSRLPAGTPIQLACSRLDVIGRAGVFCLYFDLPRSLSGLLQGASPVRYDSIQILDRQGGHLDGQTQPLTEGLRAALANGRDFYYEEGYANRWGVPVAGLLRWNQSLQLGLLAEQPLQPLYAPYRQLRNLILALSGTVLLLLLALGLLLYKGHQRARRETLHRQVLDHLPLQVRVRRPDGRVLLENQLARDGSIALPGERPLAQPEVGDLPPLSRAVWCVQREVLKTQRLCQQQLVSGTFDSDQFQFERLLGFPIWATPGKLLALGSLIIDESALQRSTQALQALTADLENQIQQRTQELALARDAAEAAARAKADFLANMSHEIRSPLNAVIGLAHLAQRCSREPRVTAYLERILKSAGHLQEVVNSILDFSKIDAGKLQIERIAFAPERLLEGVADMLWEKAQSKRLELVLDLDPRLPQQLYGDPLRIAQILLNLADNAVKFTAEGMIAVRIRLDQRQGERWALCLEVQDSGIGIAAERLADIFKPFEQLDSATQRRYGGTGLGLAICAQLAELMGGRIEARSAPGMGSLFSLSLTLDAVPLEAAPALPSAGARRVLLVESSVHSQRSLSDMLAALGLAVEVAPDGLQGLQRLRQARHEQRPYGLVLLDWNLPDLAPSEFSVRVACERLAETSALVLLCSHGAAHQLPETVQEGFAAVLDKPVTPQRLRETVLRLEPQARAPVLRGGHVLLVENEQISQDVGTELLQAMGLRVTLAGTGQAALDRLAQDASIDLVLMDVQMPGMDGLEVVRRLRPQYPHLPVIAMTASSLSGDRERCLAAGMNDYLAKPTHPDILAERLGRWLRQAPAECSTEPSAEPSAEPSSLALPAIEHLEQGRALARLLDNQALYRSLLQRFIDDYQDLSPRLHNLLAAGDSEAAMELCHSFKSVAATLGAEHLQGLTDALEMALREGRDAGPALQVFAQELQRLQQALRQGLSAVEA